MIIAGLVQDGTGNFYSIETNHTGYCGMLRYKNGTYDCNGQKIYLEFNQTHGGSFGAVTNPAGLEALKAIYGVTSVANINNSNAKYSSTWVKGTSAEEGPGGPGGGSGGGSGGGGGGGGYTPAPTPTPTPTPGPVMTAKASTTTPQHAGQPFDTTGLKITVFKDGVAYKTVTLPDSSIPAGGIKVTVNGEESGTLSSGSNDVKIAFVYYDPDVIIRQSMTTEVFTVDAQNMEIEINTVTVAITAPVKGAAPVSTATVTEPELSAGEATWTPADDKFEGGKTYTVTVPVSITDTSSYKFADSVEATVNGQNAAFDPSTGTVSYMFATLPAKSVSSIEIKTAPTKTEYKYGESVDLTGLVLTVTYDDGTTADIPYSEVGGSITVTPDKINAVGEEVLTISYGGATTTQNVTVNKADGPEAPEGLTGVAPETAGGSDGKITGLDSTKLYEYSKDGDTWTSVAENSTEITGLAADDYKVRVKKTETHEAGEAADVTVPVPTLYTVKFNMQEHGTQVPEKTAVSGSKITAPETPMAEGYTFGGWYKDAACTTAWNFASDTIIADTTLYAKWTSAAKPFTVKAAEGTDPAVTAEFSPGLLYWDGSKFGFENDQTAFSDSWNANHVNHFYWSKYADKAYAEHYDSTVETTTDTFFAESLKVDGEDWRTLSESEWAYLINERTVNGGTRYGYTCKWGTYKGVNGLIIAHDNYTGDFSDADAAIADGCVFLPAVGVRHGTDVNVNIVVGGEGFYWTSTPCESYKDLATYVVFRDVPVGLPGGDRGCGMCVRLVKSDVSVYTVTFDANGHGTAPASVDVKEGAKITEPAKPEAAGCVFGGWYKEATCDNAWDFATDTVTADTTLYAKWTVASFTVKAAEGTDPAVTAEFSPGLLYWDGSKFGFEADQTAYSSTWDANHVNHFYWSKYADKAYAENYDATGRTTTDTFFAESLEVDGKEWRTLSKDEWDYLLNEREVNGGTGEGKTFMLGFYNGVVGLIIAHDSYTGGFTGDNWVEEAIAEGCVFLRAAGSRNGTSVGNGGRGYYWSSTPYGDDNGCYLYFYDGDVYTYSYIRNCGYCVRLVK